MVVCYAPVSAAIKLLKQTRDLSEERRNPYLKHYFEHYAILYVLVEIILLNYYIEYLKAKSNTDTVESSCDVKKEANIR